MRVRVRVRVRARIRVRVRDVGAAEQRSTRRAERGGRGGREESHGCGRVLLRVERHVHRRAHLQSQYRRGKWRVSKHRRSKYRVGIVSGGMVSIGTVSASEYYTHLRGRVAGERAEQGIV